ncbi:2-polyprenyl-6-methoxyphenol hydroxylase-like FAD-dependent oxidoreductase [Pseudonocardia hierapolitana]|uniref:2-polyprenyl-6-methoxyphenol hydroxylase-like FAD-dependent oxidoreductase n=1 Tax=Pseudonocardia hierapolitana TaxID=1128676 RepID=A0A561SNM6_9PSEU|nr:FAD-dependent monooxygenase [Pseudonocardia hierapolitana]TWF76456.1 2-polyprenyl-6-methoxyphenol hydroxylase-like FAD-dependent oxidoreductase [Pseudonocardia hierapolitana]
MHEKSVLISGGGIAGPALAHWLARSGYRPTVVERSPAPRPGGQTVDLRGAGRTVVERMGLLPAVRAVTVEERGIAYVDTNGRSLGQMSAEAFGGEGVVAEIEVMRGDLAQVLLDAARDGVEYVYDDAVTAIEQDEDGVLVRFQRSAERRFGLVVGADGLHSGVRALAFGPEEGFVRPLGCVTAFFTVPDRYGLDGWMRMYNAPATMLALRPDRVSGRVKALMGFRTPPTGVHRRDAAAQRALLTRTFAGTGWVADQVIADLQDSSDLVVEELGQTRMESWSSGRVVLLGDAAWCPSPLSGLGTSTALVGAYVLAGELARAAGDHRTAFAAYEAVMRPYIAQAQELPPGGVNGFVPRTRLEIALRTQAVRWMNRWPLRNLMAAQFGKSDAIELPDYAVSPPTSGAFVG